MGIDLFRLIACHISSVVEAQTETKQAQTEQLYLSNDQVRLEKEVNSDFASLPG